MDGLVVACQVLSSKGKVIGEVDFRPIDGRVGRFRCTDPLIRSAAIAGYGPTLMRIDPAVGLPVFFLADEDKWLPSQEID